MNFTYTVKKPTDYSWGSLHSNGSWNGMIKMLLDKEVDFVSASYTITYERSQAISFANAFTSVFHVLIIKTPADLFNFHAYLEPFTNFSWISAIIFISLGPLTLLSTNMISKTQISNPWITLIGAIGSRSSNDWPKQLSSQVATFSLLTFGILST